MKKLILILLYIAISLGATDNIIKEQDLNGQTIVIEHNNYKILQFNKQISDIRLSTKDILSVIYIDDNKKPFTKIKVLAKAVGVANALVTFYDKTTMLINFTTIKDIRDIQAAVKHIAPDAVVTQIGESVIIKGVVQNSKVKKKIIGLINNAFKKPKIVNLLNVIVPDNMVRLKLYVVEINNNDGETIKNNWSLGGFNDGTTSLDIQSTMLNAVTLTGGITAVANHIGRNFNTGLTLNYLKSNGVAKVLDETTLVTMENQDARFHAGGNILVETSSTSADGQPISQIETIPYGLELNINVKDVINDKYVRLEIDTKSSSLDPINGVGELPATKEKSIKTSVVIENEATIVLGGLINNTNTKDFEKIPLLGDIPIIGKIFQSKDFQAGKSELVFFITPTIVTTTSNNQQKDYKKIKNKVVPPIKIKVKQKPKIEKVTEINSKKQLTNEELHQQRLHNLLGM